MNNAFKREGKKYAIPGFRQQGSPSHDREDVMVLTFSTDAVNDLFPGGEAAVKEAKIDVVSRP